MVSDKGNDIANQFYIETPEGAYFQSYTTIIAFVHRDSRQVTLDRDKWDYSVTTSKYRNKLLGEDTAATRKKIESGVYKLAELN